MKRLALALMLLTAPASADTVPEPQGYRGPPYSAPVPATLAGATVADNIAAAQLHSDGVAVFVDVMPRDVKPADLPEDTIWREKPRMSIPGAIWLPNTGFEALSPQEDTYLKAGLAHATGGDMAKPVVIFCREECWMSWNVAKRALGYGYSEVIWYPDGPEGWVTLPDNPALVLLEPLILP